MSEEDKELIPADDQFDASSNDVAEENSHSSYKVPGGICEIEKSTGYWRYVSDEADEIQAKKESEFISDEEIIHNVKFFLSERGIFENVSDLDRFPLG